MPTHPDGSGEPRDATEDPLLRWSAATSELEAALRYLMVVWQRAEGGESRG